MLTFTILRNGENGFSQWTAFRRTRNYGEFLVTQAGPARGRTPLPVVNPMLPDELTGWLTTVCRTQVVTWTSRRCRH